jgi:hypothetical protein
MNIKSNKSFGVVSYDIESVNLNEMRQMHELNGRISDVLDSHKPDSKEKKYLCDDDLHLMRAILSVFTRDYNGVTISAFDEFLKSKQKEGTDEQLAPQAVEEDDE